MSSGPLSKLTDSACGMEQPQKQHHAMNEVVREGPRLFLNESTPENIVILINH